MKILYITTMYPTQKYPQKGIFCHEQVKALKKLGVEVDVVVPIPFYDREVSVKEWLYEGVKINYVRFFKLPGARDFHKTGHALYRALKRRIDLKKYDIYHADAALPTGYAMMKATRKLHKPFVVHGHGLDVFLEESYAGLKNCEQIVECCKLVYQNADAVIGVSRKVLEKIQTKLDITEKDFVAYNGVDVEKFAPSERVDTEEVIRIISIGNLIPLKGHEYTLRAISQLIDQGYENVQLTLLGKGELEPELKALVEELKIENYVTFGGYVPYEQVAQQLKESHIFVLPSYYEALGCVYLEAMACEIPVIGCRNNGIDEIIKDGKTGFLVDIKSVEQITERLQDLMSDMRRSEMGKEARKQMVSNYQWSHSAKSVRHVYEHILNVREK